MGFKVLDLFSGIGGFSLGLERAGMRTVAFCDIAPYCQAILRKHWPDVPVWGDVRTLTFTEAYTDSNGDRSYQETFDEHRKIEFPNGEISEFGSLGGALGQRIDVICGGFPCQDISIAGKGAGIEGSRSGLWSEYARIIGEVRPRYVIVENVAALLGRGIERVLGDLAALGYDAEWHCISAAAVGAPHRRDRVWIVGHSNAGRQLQSQRIIDDIGRWLGDASWWLTEPNVGRVAHGVPFRVDRLRSLGNAIVPQIAEIIGKAIIAHDSHPSSHR